MSAAGFASLLGRIGREAAKKSATRGPRLGTAFGSYAGLAKSLIDKAGHSRTSKRFFSRDKGMLADALKNWERSQGTLSKVSKYASPDTRLPIMLEAMDAEKELTRALLRAGIERKRTAQLLQRLKGLTEPGDALRTGLSKPGGSGEVWARSPQEMENKIASFRGFRYPSGADAPRGAMKFTPSAAASDDLALLGHEFGHGIYQAERGLPRSAGAARQALQGVIPQLETQATAVPFRPGGTPLQLASARASARQQLAQRLPPGEARRYPPEELRRLQQELGMVRGTPAFEHATPGLDPKAKAALSRGFHSRESHGAEEPMADLISILLDPKMRQRLPYREKVSLARMFPSAFPELAPPRGP